MATESGSPPLGGATPGLPGPAVSRRAVLAGAAGTSVAGALWLAGCGSGTSAGSAATGTTAAARGAGKAGLVLVPRFDNAPDYVVTGSEQRLCFGLGSTAGEIVNDGPATLAITLVKDGKEVGPPISVPRHKGDIPSAYYPLRTTFAAPGIYKAVAVVDGVGLDQTFQVSAPGPDAVPGRGQKLLPFDTPTTKDHKGVEPICTRKPEPCPFHDVTLTEAMAAGAPVAFIVSTPAFCQTAVCGPVLEILTKAAKDFPSHRFVHAEVYKDAAARGNFEQAEVAPVISAYHLTFEPCLFVADKTGTIVERLDNVFDGEEIAAALKKAAG